MPIIKPFLTLSFVNCQHFFDKSLIEWSMIFYVAADKFLIQDFSSNCQVSGSAWSDTGMKMNLLKDIFLCSTSLNHSLDIRHYWSEGLNSLGIISSKELCDSLQKWKSNFFSDLLVPALEIIIHQLYDCLRILPFYPLGCNRACCPSTCQLPLCLQSSGL